MFAHWLAARLGRVGIHYGWVLVAITFLNMICLSAAATLPGVLIQPLTAEFGWATADVAGAIGIMYVAFACTAPFSGALLLRYGVTRMVVLSAALAATGLVITTMVEMRWQLNVGIGLCMGVAAGMLSLGLAATVASRWFVARRGLVVGLLTAAFAAGQLTFLPLAAWLSTTYGWRYAVVPAVIGALVCAVLFLLLGRDWPANVGLAPHGGEKSEPPPRAAGGALAISFAALREASTVPVFWILAATFFICGLSSSGIVQQHFIPFCADNGIGAVTAASYLAVMGLFNFLGTICSGWLSDRFDNRVLLAVYYGLRGLSLIWLPFSDLSVFALTIWAVFFGLDFVATVPPTVRLTGQRFGPAKGPVLFGWIFAAHQLGSAVAAYGSGLTRDLMLTYLPAFVAAGVACLIAAALFALVRAPRPAVAAA
ncbi:MAG: MFS transporter [Alphaproteobacteria bacterium]